jgi:hypothetical protein
MLVGQGSTPQPVTAVRNVSAWVAARQSARSNSTTNWNPHLLIGVNQVIARARRQPR